MTQVQDMICVEVPLRVLSEANAHTHWRLRQKRAKDQRGIVRAYIARHLWKKPKPIVVEMIRIAPRELDSDNCVGAFKHVRDEIAKIMGFNDRDKAVEWKCSQEKPKFKGQPHAIRIIVRWV